MIHRVQLAPPKIFHGLSKVFLVPNKIAGLVEAKVPGCYWKVAGAARGISYQQSAFLVGATSGGSPTAGSQTIELAGSLAAGNVLRIAFQGVPVQGTLADGPYEEVVVEAVAQSSVLATAAQALKTNVNVAIAGSGSIVNGRVYCSNQDATKADISAALQLKFASPGISGSGAILTILGATSGGTAQNQYDFTVEILPTPPGILTTSADGIPDYPGIKFLGATLDLGYNFSGQTNKVTCHQKFFPIDEYVQGSTGEINISALEDLSPDVLRAISSITGRSSTDAFDIILPNLFSVGQTYGLITVTDNPDAGIPDIGIFRKVRSDALNLSRKVAHAPVQAKFSLIDAGTQDLCYFTQGRAAFAA